MSNPRPPNPKKWLADPYCPFDMWWIFAETHPIEAMGSPLFDILTLETPERWVSMEQRLHEKWLETYMGELDAVQRQAFMYTCMARYHLANHSNPDEWIGPTNSVDGDVRMLIKIAREVTSLTTHRHREHIDREAMSAEVIWQWRHLLTYFLPKTKVP